MFWRWLLVGTINLACGVITFILLLAYTNLGAGGSTPDFYALAGFSLWKGAPYLAWISHVIYTIIDIIITIMFVAGLLMSLIGAIGLWLQRRLRARAFLLGIVAYLVISCAFSVSTLITEFYKLAIGAQTELWGELALHLWLFCLVPPVLIYLLLLGARYLLKNISPPATQ